MGLEREIRHKMNRIQKYTEISLSVKLHFFLRAGMESRRPLTPGPSRASLSSDAEGPDSSSLSSGELSLYLDKSVKGAAAEMLIINLRRAK